MNKNLLLAGAAVCLLSANANALDLQQYVSAKMLYSDVSHDIKVTEAWGFGEYSGSASGKAKFSDEVWGGSLAYGVKSGALRTELELNLKSDAEKKYADEWSTEKVSMENNSVMLNAYYDIDTGTRFTPYVGAGIGVSHLKGTYKWSSNDTDIDENGKYSKSKNNFTWQVGAGVAYALTDNISVDAGYRYTDAGDLKITDAGDGYIDTYKAEAKAHEFLLGVRYTF